MDQLSRANAKRKHDRLRDGLWILSGLWLGVLFGAPLLAEAQGPIQVRIPLPKLAPVQTATLRGISNSYSLKIPIPARWELQRARLHFSYVNSTALLAQNSRLVVRLNGRPLAQATLQPLSPVGEVAVNLPVRLLPPGYQDLEFSVSQHYTMDCEFPEAPELWTTLELDQSYIDFEFRLKKLPLALSTILDHILDPRLATPNSVNLVIERLSPELLDLAAIVASGIAVRMDYRPIHFSLSQQIRPGMDNVLIADPKFLSQCLGEGRPSIKGPILQFLHLRFPEPAPSTKVLEDPTRALILVGGENLEQMKIAAQTLAAMSFPYPGVARMEIQNIHLPPLEPSKGKNLLSPEGVYSFQRLGLDSHTFRGMAPPPKKIAFRVPTDFSGHPNRFGKLVLHIAYGSGLRKDSVLNVFLNEKFLSSIFLDNPQGGSYRNYEIPIPAYLLRRGQNVLSFAPVLTPLITGYCEFIQTENLLLTLFGDSTFHMPPMFRWVDLPRMELFFEDGFPFTRFADGREATVFVAEKSWECSAAALNLLAIAAQKVGYPALGIRFQFDPPGQANEEMIAVGPLSQMPEELKKGSPLQLSAPEKIPYVQWKRLEEKASKEGSWLSSFLEKFLPLPPGRYFSQPAFTVDSHQVSGLGPRRILLSQFQSPFKEFRTVLLLTGESSKDLLEGSGSLWEPSVQGRLHGDLAIVEIREPDFPLTAMAVGSKYYVGEADLLSRLSLWLYNHPGMLLLFLLLALVILTAGIYYFLRAFRRRRLKPKRT